MPSSRTWFRVDAFLSAVKIIVSLTLELPDATNTKILEPTVWQWVGIAP